MQNLITFAKICPNGDILRLCKIVSLAVVQKFPFAKKYFVFWPKAGHFSAELKPNFLPKV